MATQPIYALTDTWDTTATTYAGLSLSVTDTASAAGSNLLELRGGAAGTTSVFSVRKDGYAEVNPTAADGSTATVFRINFGTQNLQIRNVVSGYWNIEASGNVTFVTGKSGIGNSGVSLTSDAPVRWTSSTSGGGITGTTDLFLARDAANTLAQRNGTNAQTFRLYRTYTAADNFQRLTITSASATLSALSGASVTSSALIPAGAVVVGVTARVSTLIEGASGFQIGTVADPDRWGDITGTAVGTTSDNANWTSGTIECFTAATDVVVTAKTSNFTAGAILVTIHYLAGQAD